ncbi:o-succinylbenzoate synthase [Cerasibacillus terrae]|uniref:o-succinylbenzoate synthase n=1 Tax=Cerasibacillus terrae TaxID=2498845 RepID=A0A5C8NTN3_9BACI|nr:o-succinylbenzoate synthase [Cerasibacillus terrae]TXL64533.1 o-succinylbenzoate synthase [Cerasibacillus terrae]
MKQSIQKIILHRLHMRLNNPFTTSFGTMQDKDFFIIEVIDQDGHQGFGESAAFSAPWYTEETVETTLHMLRDFLIPLIQKHDFKHPQELTKIFQAVKRNNMAKAAIEGALWDLYAKQQNISLAKALGGEKETIDVGISIGIQPSIQKLLQSIDNALQQGFKRIKLKIKPDQDIELLKEVRTEFPTTPIMADANSAYTLDDINLLRELDQFNLMMIEQPLAHDDIVDHAKLQQHIQTPICLDESIHSFQDVKKAIELGSCQIINVKSSRVGGLTESVRIHDYCKEHHIPIWCGGMLEAGIGRAHNIALTSLANFTLPGDTAGSSHYWQRDIIQPEVTVENGTIQVPTKPGIGYEIDREALQYYTVEQQIFTL